MNKKIAAVAAAIITGISLTGCAMGSNDRDLEGVPFKDPDKIEVYINIDDNPNIVRLCIGTTGFATTSRINGEDALTRVPEFDAWCKE